MLFEKEWKVLGQRRFYEEVSLPANRVINYIGVIDNWQDGSNGKVKKTGSVGQRCCSIKIKGLNSRGVSWKVLVTSVKL